MKRSSTPFVLRQARPRSGPRPRLRSWYGRLGAVAILSCALLPVACVTRGTHDEVVNELDRQRLEAAALRERVRVLDVSNQSLNAEMATALEQLEEQRIGRVRAEQQVAVLSETGSRLSRELSEVQRNLALTSQEVVQLTGTYKTLVSDLEAELSAGQIEIEQLREGLRVNVSDDILFASGSAELDPVGEAVLLKVIARLRSLDHMVVVEGHTDDVPIRGGLAKRFPSNWDLAAARSARVVRLMEANGIAGDRLSSVSYSSYRPVAPNDTPEQRAQNRRIEIRLQPREGTPVKTGVSP